MCLPQRQKQSLLPLHFCGNAEHPPNSPVLHQPHNPPNLVPLCIISPEYTRESMHTRVHTHSQSSPLHLTAQGLFDVESALLRSPKDLHGQGFPGAAEAGGRGAGAKGGSARRQRAGGRGGRGGAPREVYVDEEFDLEDFEGDEMQYEEGALQLDVMDKWEEEEGEGEGEEGRQQRRRQRH